MAKLTAFIERNEKNKFVEMIDKNGDTIGYPRGYIGLSGLGGGCSRALWYTFRFAKKGTLSGRTNRIFSVGHAAEEIMVKDLEGIGIKCWNVLDDQDEFVAAYGYAKGHPDGYASGIPGNEEEVHLLEFKTANDASFKLTEKKGIKESKPTYYGQVVAYMHFSGLKKAFFMMVNKNTSAYYIEIVESNDALAKELVKKAEIIVWCEDSHELQRIGNNSPQWYECKWCGYNDICFGKELPESNCRNCKWFDLIGDGKFTCSKQDDKELSLEEQYKGCGNYSMMECFKID